MSFSDRFISVFSLCCGNFEQCTTVCETLVGVNHHLVLQMYPDLADSNAPTGRPPRLTPIPMFCPKAGHRQGELKPVISVVPFPNFRKFPLRKRRSRPYVRHHRSSAAVRRSVL